MRSRSDAQRASKQKEMKEKELELCAFNAEHIEDSGHTQSLVRFKILKWCKWCEWCDVEKDHTEKAHKKSTLRTQDTLNRW